MTKLNSFGLPLPDPTCENPTCRHPRGVHDLDHDGHCVLCGCPNYENRQELTYLELHAPERLK